MGRTIEIYEPWETGEQSLTEEAIEEKMEEIEQGIELDLAERDKLCRRQVTINKLLRPSR